MNVMVAGFDADATRRLSQELRGAGHAVLGAPGRQSVRTFLHATVPEVVVVPSGETARVREWTSDLGLGLAFVEVKKDAPEGAAAAALKRFQGGPEPTKPAPPGPDDDTPTVIVESAAEPLFSILGHRTPSREMHADSVEDDDPSDPPPLPVEAPAARPKRRMKADGPPAATPLDPRSTARDAAQTGQPGQTGNAAHPDIVAKLAQVRFADYFQILEVEPGGSPFQAREAHERLTRRYSPRGWTGRLMPDEIDMLDEITRGIADAALVLTDPELRVRYERAFGGPGALRRAP